MAAEDFDRLALASSEEGEFWSFAGEQLGGWGLHPSVVSGLLGPAPGQGRLKTFRPPGGKFLGHPLGFSQGGSIYLRPELVRVPWLFKLVLRREMLRSLWAPIRGPPGILRKIHSWLAPSAESLEGLRVPALDRVLREARLSLRLQSPFDLLIVHPARGEMLDPSEYREMSSGNARITTLPRSAWNPHSAGLSMALEKGRAPSLGGAGGLLDLLSRPENEGRFRFIVLPSAEAALPEPGAMEHKRLEAALRVLDEVIQAVRKAGISPEDDARPSGPQARALSAAAARFGLGAGAESSGRGISRAVGRIFTEAAREHLAGLGLVRLAESLYRGLRNSGAALLPLARGPAGEVIERLLGAWQAPDNGRFLVQRVDLAEGTSVLVLRKDEPRVNLWLHPAPGFAIQASGTNLDRTDPGGREALLRSMGFKDEEIKLFDEAGMSVRHVFGADVGENRAFVSVRRSHARLLRRFGGPSGVVASSSRSGFQVHLLDSPKIQGVLPVWDLGLKGEGGRIYDIDTGLDSDHPDFADRPIETVDFVDEGPEDWGGHGTHKAGISYANGALHKGMAPAALGRMGKVFSQEGAGASDGDIMAAGVDAMKWKADVLSLSLGSPGTSDLPLAEFFSGLVRRKNAAGEHPVATASAGNSGPFDRTLSQPSVGEDLISVAAAAKSLDDARPEIAFFSSVGPASDERWGLPRLRLKPEITALGGDVVTPPGVRDIYALGIESVKSKDKPPGPSDAADGLHTRLAGTSMSNPQVAAAALLVKQAVRQGCEPGSPGRSFFFEHLPLAVKMLLMRSAKDMRVPVFFQGAGFLDARAAVRSAAGSFGFDLGGALSRAWRALGSVFGIRAAAEAPGAEPPWGWLTRVMEVMELEDGVYDAALRARDAILRKGWTPGGAGPSPKTGEPGDIPLPDAVSEELNAEAGRAMADAFNQGSARSAGRLLAALKDPEWIVRFHAAFALLNLRPPGALAGLAEAGAGDPDGRVRQLALLAAAEIPGKSGDERLREAAASSDPETALYASYALLRHGDPSRAARIAAGAASPDKSVRFTAVWLLGRLGKAADGRVSGALALRVADDEERGNIRHLGAASLTRLASEAPESVDDGVLLALLGVCGPKNFALTRTVSRFFKAASRREELRARLRAEPVRPAAAAFVEENKAFASKPGALGEMVRTLAQVLNLPLETP
jgi:subtilisin family serine protease